MAEEQQPLDMIGIRLNSILAPVCECIEKLCVCIRDYAASTSQPCWSESFFFRGSISQTINTWEAVNIFQVPVGQTATITRVSFAERYPGTLYGAAFSLLINNNLDPRFPRVDHPVGSGLEHGLEVRICLDEQDTISLLVECLWKPVEIGQADTYVQAMFPYEISGFYEYKEVA